MKPDSPNRCQQAAPARVSRVESFDRISRTKPIMVFSEINSALSLWEKLKGWHYSRKPQPETIVTRFVRLFETHGVHRNQIPRFIGHGLTLKDVQDDAALLTKLDEPLLEAACEKFAVRREWLDGAEERIHPCHDFYKHPEWFGAFLKEKMAANPEGDWHGVLLAPEEQNNDAWALLILQETVGWVGEKPIYRLHLCNNWLFSYWKARAYLAACVAIAWKRQAFISGRYLPKREIDKLASGMTLLGWQGEGIWEFNGKCRWYAEDLALEPEAFLDGVDPERDNYGIRSGLDLWLRLDENGLMDTGIDKKNYRQLFEQERAKY